MVLEQKTHGTNLILRRHIQETLREHIDVCRWKNPGKNYNLLRLISKYDISTDVRLYLAINKKLMPQICIDKKKE